MQTTTNPEFGLLDSLTPTTPANDFLERLDHSLDWKPIERALRAMYPVATGCPPCEPLTLFKIRLPQRCYDLSDPQCEELVSDRFSWRRFAGLGLQDKVPDPLNDLLYEPNLPKLSSAYGSDNSCQVWLNGERLANNERIGSLESEGFTINPLPLKLSWNQFVIKIVQGNGE